MGKQDFWLVMATMTMTCMGFEVILVVAGGIWYGLLALIAPVVTTLLCLVILDPKLGGSENG